MRKLAAVVALAGVCALAPPAPARAEIGTIDAVPAATLLLPYFEVDMGSASGRTTVFSVNNASASAAIANVVLWTDWGIPTFAFEVYLTGYDVQRIDLRDVFNGVLPVTADAGSDPADTISPRGFPSQDINFPGATGPCNGSTLYNQPDPTLALKIQHLNAAHRGSASPLNGQCWGASHGDQVVRGYVTVDTVTTCSLLVPSTPGYFFGIADGRNILFGDYAYIDSAQNFAQGDTLVHVEACSIPSVGDGAGRCPFVAGDYTFYARYVAGTAADQREPLPTTFGARYVNGGQDGEETDLLVWRDSKMAPSGASGPRPCGSQPSWFPLAHSDIVAFDLEEQVADLCFIIDNNFPPVGGQQACLPLLTQRAGLDGAGAFNDPTFVPPFSGGWIYLNLNHTVPGDVFPGVAQSWVSTIRSRSGRFSVGYGAVAFDNALDASPGGRLLVP